MRDSTSTLVAEPLRVLIVEDSVADTELLVRELGRCLEVFTWERVDDMAALEAAIAQAPDVVICDIVLPRLDGLAAIAAIRSGAPDTVLIAVTGELDDRTTAELLAHGVDDYLLKDRLGRLGSAIERQRLQRRQQRRAQGLIRGQTEILTSVAMGSPLAATLEAIVRLAEAHAAGALCAVQTLEGGALRHGAAPSLPEEWNRFVDGTPIGPATGSCGTAAFRGEAVIVTDIATDPLWADYRERALGLGLRACWSRPVFSTDREVLGTFAMYYTEARAPDRDDEELVEVILGLISVALEKSRADASARLAQRVLDSMLEGVMVLDPGFRAVAVNAAFTNILGRTLDEVRGQAPDFLDDELRQALDKHGSWQGEIRWRRRGGETFPALVSFSTLRDLQGGTANYVGVFTDVSALRDHEQRLAHLTRFDLLTGLPNRNEFQRVLGAVLQQAEKHGHGAAVVFLDLDNFKVVNDSLGHAAGDRLLQSTAARLRDCVRGADMLARFGGDEFAIVLAEVDGPDDCSTFMQRVVEAMSHPFMLDERELYVTTSAGIALFPQDGVDGTLLMSEADAAMHRAKQEGRNSFQFFSKEINEQALENLVLANSLRTALDRGELSLHYQPRYRMDSGAVTGVEALLRWKNPELGMVPPDRFIPVAEGAGLIVAIGDWVLREACRQALAWPGIPVAVNLSARQFAQPDFAGHVCAIVAESGVAPERLVLEITESMLMADAERGAATVRDLHEAGFTIAVDDFGTGYSSLSYLKRFIIDELKIDRVFVSDLPRDEDDAAIVRAIIGIARSLGLRTVAEGVETEEQLEFLKSVGCDEAQGYLFSRPLPATELKL